MNIKTLNSPIIGILILGMLFFFHPWFYFFGRQFKLQDDKKLYEPDQNILNKRSGRTYSGIFEWQPEPFEDIDDHRIFMHGEIEGGKISPKQICSIESAAKHNPDRSVQIFIRLPLNSQINLVEQNKKNSSWNAILNQYKNLRIIFFNETEFFKNTPVMEWYTNGKWQHSPQQSAHLSGYARLVSIFRGGGIFLDLDAVITLKPLRGPKWWNFLVKRKTKFSKNLPEYIASSKILHLAYGHHLSDELILNLGKTMYHPWTSNYEPFLSTLHNSFSRICMKQKRKNLCPDVQLLKHKDVFLPHIGTTFWRQTLYRLHQIADSSTIDNEAIQLLVKNTIDSYGAPLITWKSMSTTKKDKEKPEYQILFSTLMSQHCPVTFVSFFNCSTTIPFRLKNF